METKKPQLDDYVLGKTLGEGYHAKVKLAFKNGKQYAAKIFKNNHGLEQNLESLSHEISMMQMMNHPNLVNLVEVISNGTYTKKNGQTSEALAIILEYADGGELFHYIASSGRFSEEISRAYFHQLIEGLEYMHTNGISHRDMKPDNLLFDKDFNLKIADFGFATLLEGKEGNGLLKTYLGTENYMAPEIHAQLPYNGASVDLFAAGIILFVMQSGHAPFRKGDPKDPYYKLICSNRHEFFWQAHNKSKGNNEFYSNDFKTLINSMLAHDTTQRLSIAQIKIHPWYTGPVASLEQIKTQFLARYQKVQASLEQDKLEKINQKLEQKNKEGKNMMFIGANKFRSGGQNEAGEFAGIIEAFNLMSVTRTIRDAEQGDDSISNLKTAWDADYIFKFLLLKHIEFSKKATPSDKYYKIKFSALDKNSNPAQFSIEIKKVDDEINILNFQRIQGDPLSYFEIVNQIKDRISSA